MNKLEKILGLKIHENNEEDRRLVDFELSDEQSEVFWCAGDRFDDIDWECKHPMEYVSLGDEDEYGECLVCGSHCSWGFVKEWLDEGHDDETGSCIGQEIKVARVGEWFPRRSVGGAVGKYLKELQAKNA